MGLAAIILIIIILIFLRFYKKEPTSGLFSEILRLKSTTKFDFNHARLEDSVTIIRLRDNSYILKIDRIQKHENLLLEIKGNKFKEEKKKLEKYNRISFWELIYIDKETREFEIKYSHQK